MIQQNSCLLLRKRPKTTSLLLHWDSRHLILGLYNSTLGLINQQDWSEDKEACHLAWGPTLDPWYPQTVLWLLCIHFHACAKAHTHIYSNYISVIKTSKVNFPLSGKIQAVQYSIQGTKCHQMMAVIILSSASCLLAFLRVGDSLLPQKPKNLST